MRPTDLESAVGIIGAHQPEDGRLARRYYESFFGSDASRERTANFVALLGETHEVVGVGGYEPGWYDWRGILWLSWLYVAKEHQGAGIGGLLLRRLLADARRLDTRKVYLDTSSDPSYDRAVAVYRHFGFREEGRLTDYYAPGEDLLIFALDLESGGV